jgi:hypothetical protein
MEETRQLNWTLKDDCLVIDNFLKPEECKSIIDYYEAAASNGHVYHKVSLERTDSVFFAPLDAMPLTSDAKLISLVTDRILNVGLGQYSQCFPVLTAWLKNAAFSNSSFKIQKTPAGGGFHSWHHEQSDASTIDRFLTWTIYLNEVEGGETEFLYRKFRVEPKQGRFCIFPCHFTTVHRGNPPLDKDKYIVTGWFTVHSVSPDAFNT